MTIGPEVNGRCKWHIQTKNISFIKLTLSRLRILQSGCLSTKEQTRWEPLEKDKRGEEVSSLVRAKATFFYYKKVENIIHEKKKRDI